MNDLITIDFETENPTVSGRDLHNALGVQTAYKDWFPRMCEYGFSEGTDYSSFLSDRSDGLPGKPRTDHRLTIPMAKELCMLQRSDKGKTFRQYFISIEEQWNRPEAVMARALRLADSKIKQLQGKIEEVAPKVLFADAVSASHTSILVGDLAKLLRQNGIDIGQNRLFQRLRDEGFLIKSGERRNMPTQRYMDMGLFQIKETSINNPDGSIRVTRTVKVTGKGQQFFINKYLAAKPVQ